MPHASIDIGSNTLLLTIVADDGSVVHDEARVVGMSRGLGELGQFASDRIAAADAVLADYVALAAEAGVEAWRIKAVATSGARRAMNAKTWLARVQRRLGLRVRIITGEEEAELTWKGARRDLALPDAPRLVVDVGGSSTEVVLGDDRSIDFSRSLEIGSVRLTEAFLEPGAREGVYQRQGLVRLRSEIAMAFSTVTLPREPEVVIGVAGTVTTLMACALGLESYDPAAVHGAALTREHLARFTETLLPLGPEARRAAIAVAPKRADYLLAGIAILDAILARTHRSSMICSDRGLRFGLLPA